MVKRIRTATHKDFPLNEPLQHSVYDESNRLLLRRGYVLTMPGFSDKILARGCYIGEPEKEPEIKEAIPDPGRSASAGAAPGSKNTDSVSIAQEPVLTVFQLCAELITRLRSLQRQMVGLLEPIAGIGATIGEQALQLLRLLDREADAVLAACMLLNETKDNRPTQQVLGAAVAALLSGKLQLPPEQKLTLIKAALTRDLGLLEIDRAFAGVTPLPETATAKVRAHTLRSVTYLQQQGILDPDWLRIVKQHHERLDGSGYPAGLVGDQIDPLALLLGLSDSYAGMVLSNQRRPGMAPPVSMRQLVGVKNASFSEQHIAILVRQLGLYPPGTLVKLKSGEAAVVRNSSPPGRSPLVFAFYDRDGMVRSTPLARDTNQPDFSIVECLAPEQCLSAKLVIRRLWL